MSLRESAGLLVRGDRESQVASGQVGARNASSGDPRHKPLSSSTYPPSLTYLPTYLPILKLFHTYLGTYLPAATHSCIGIVLHCDPRHKPLSSSTYLPSYLPIYPSTYIHIYLPTFQPILPET